MPFPANVYSVLIASPSDVAEERIAIAQSLHDWNALNSKLTGKVLLPVMWETHSAPEMGERPQELINERVVRTCDMLIGAFWQRLGSPTGVEASGTVEEIKWFLKEKRPVMLYFSDKDIPRSQIDTKQLDALNEFQSSIRNKGLQENYCGVDDLKVKLSRHLTIIMRDMDDSPVLNRNLAKKAIKSVDDVSEDNQVKVENDSREPTNSIQIIDHSDKAILVKGDTTSFKDEFKAIHGRWNSVNSGWIFSKKRLAEVASILNIPAEMNG
jgi:hypothetical protein